MSNKVMIGRYFPVKSLIHRMNPLAKIICTFLFIAVCFLANTLRFNLVTSILLILIILSTNIPVKLYLKMILSLRWFILAIILIHLPFTLNIELITINVIRAIYIVLYSSVLTLTTPPSELNHGLTIFFAPLKLIRVNVNQLALSMTLALRFIPGTMDTVSRIMKTQASRGIDYKNSNLKGKLVAMKAVLVPMFSLTFKRADNLALSMESRLYDISRRRVNFRQNKWKLYDTFLILLHTGLVVVIVRGLI